MPKGYKVTLKSNQFTKAGKSFIKPFEAVFDKGSKELAFFNDRAFEIKECHIPEQNSPVPAASKGESVQASKSTSISVHDLEGIPDKVKVILVAAGFDTVEKILSEDVDYDDLTALSGIGEATADKIIEACEATREEPEE
jgi:hypothetical protein